MERRSLLFQLVRRDFEQRFVGSAVGWIWGLIHPLVLLLSWVFVFQVCLGMKAPAGEQKYSLFIFAGMLPWLLFSETVQRCAPSLLDQANLITKTVFPAEIVPVSVFLSTLISHLLAVALMVTAAGLWINQISIFLVLLPLYMLTVGLFAVGIGWIVASLHVFLRDTAHFLSVILIMWFWATPIFIEEGKFPAGGEVPVAGQSALLRGASVPRHIAAFRPAAFRRPGHFRAVWDWSFRGGRIVLPLHEAWIRRRTLTANVRTASGG